MRTQQVVAYESSFARTVDPLGGSYYVEHLTDRMEEEILRVMGEVDAYGGVVKAIESGWLQMRIAARALERKRKSDSGETVIVGQNHFRRAEQKDSAGEVFRLDPQLRRKVLEQYEAVRARRDNAAVERALSRLDAAAGQERENLLPYFIDCCHAYATVGEMTGRLKARWGEFQEPVGL